MDEKGIWGILNKILGLSAKLPAPLAYGGLVVVAIVGFAVLQRREIPGEVIVLLAIVYLSALVAFVYSDARQRKQLKLGPVDFQETGDQQIDGVLGELRDLHALYSKILPSSDLLPALRKLFARNTFEVTIEKCTSQDWITRLRVACLTERILLAYSPSVSEKWSNEHRAFYDHLLGQMGRYCDDLTGLFEKRFALSQVEEYLDKKEVFERHVPKPLLRMELRKHEDKNAAMKQCDRDLERISDLWESIGQRATLRQKPQPQ